MTLEKIATLIGARIYGNATNRVVDWLLTDSRSLAFPESTLFFAIRTRTGDGHRYIADLYRRGVRGFVVGAVPTDADRLFPEATFLLVVSPLKALQRLAERHREELEMPVVGITGSNGKTVVKEWLYQLLAPYRRVTRSPRSYNSQIGVPLSVWLLTSQTEVGVFEAGISQVGEMQALRAIVQPTIGIMTNVGEAHQENFATKEEKCLEKLSLFKDAEVLIYCADDDVVKGGVEAMNYAGCRFAWSLKGAEETTLQVSAVQKDEYATQIVYTYEGATHTFCLPFIDAASLQNALHCLSACLLLGLSAEAIATGMANLEPVAMRLEVKQGLRGCMIINDCYNSDINSLDIALDFACRRFAQTAAQRRVLVLSDMEQTGVAPKELYERVAQMLAGRGVDYLIGVGAEISAAHALFTLPKSFFHSVEDLMESGLLGELQNDVVLLKGSRRAGFERIAEALSQKVHETTLEVNLEAVAQNLTYYRSLLSEQTKMVCMIKASAYGSGAVEIAKTLQERGVDYLAVAVADEGAELRAAGITGNIIVMNPEMSSFATLFAHRLEPEVYNFNILEALIRAAEREGITNFPVHIKLDTGMTRLGFHPKHDMEALVQRLKSQTALLPRSVFSHLAGSDSADFDTYTRQQFATFDAASLYLQSNFEHKVLRHICNSAGIERFPEYHLDMVRLGLGLYGVSPVDNRTLHNVASLKTTILQIREVGATTTVGYSRRGTLRRSSRIAALPIGYADGLNRRMGNGRGYCLVNGQPAPYVGNICMDVCMIDVTDIPCREGDLVEIFGDNLPVAQLAEWLETIPYEVLTSVSERVKRVYLA
ncbi:MAG: bifunctional UDP-N-acetylmuramoyl-tripeptide:D-alanyl-D-alanine ligase/alanine racemase [Bacteroidaceae bacterium]|nr:bifunctional UDP-N-acetylmuramoyl-tripeptide:D-alanyl-D-alanine ligase/alanine racemase [Bacteroidaceae bacterium]